MAHFARYLSGTLLTCAAMSSVAQAADDAAAPGPAPAGGAAASQGSGGASLQQLQQQVQALQQKVDALSQSQSAGSAAGYEDRLWRLEADALTDTNLTLGGSGGVTFTAVKQVGRSLDADANPMLLYAYQNELLFVGEFNCDQANGVSLGQAYAAYTALPHAVIEAGLFPLPFAAYSERFSPQWINREAVVAPSPYADAYGVFAGDQTDVGIQVRGDLDLGDNMKANYHVFLTEGPSYNDPNNATPDDRLAFGGVPGPDHVPPTVGARLGWIPTPGSELGISGMTGGIHNNATFDPTIDTTARRSFVAGAIDAEHRVLGILFLGEVMLLHYQDAEGAHHHVQGAYLEASRLWHAVGGTKIDLEPVLRAGEVRRDTVEAGYKKVAELDAGVNAYVGWHLHLSINGEFHSQHALDQITSSVIVPF